MDHFFFRQTMDILFSTTFISGFSGQLHLLDYQECVILHQPCLNTNKNITRKCTTLSQLQSSCSFASHLVGKIWPSFAQDMHQPDKYPLDQISMTKPMTSFCFGESPEMPYGDMSAAWGAFITHGKWYVSECLQCVSECFLRCMSYIHDVVHQKISIFHCFLYSTVSLHVSRSI